MHTFVLSRDLGGYATALSAHLYVVFHSAALRRN